MAHKQLKKPFSWPWAVSRIVCSHCNTVKEIDQETTEKLLRIINLLQAQTRTEEVTKEKIKNYFFESNYCKECGKKDVLILEFKKI